MSDAIVRSRMAAVIDFHFEPAPGIAKLRPVITIATKSFLGKLMAPCIRPA